jgi:hypothetical protein
MLPILGSKRSKRNLGFRKPFQTVQTAGISALEHPRGDSANRCLHRRAQAAQLPDYVRDYLRHHLRHLAGRPGQGIQPRPERTPQDHRRRPRHGLGWTHQRADRRIRRRAHRSSFDSGCVRHQVRSLPDQNRQPRTASQRCQSQPLTTSHRGPCAGYGPTTSAFARSRFRKAA